MNQNISLISSVNPICKNSNKCIHSVEFIDKNNVISKKDMYGSSLCDLLEKNNSIDILGSYLHNHFTNNGFLKNLNIKKFIKFNILKVDENKYAAKLNNISEYFVKNINLYNNDNKLSFEKIKSILIKNDKDILFQSYGNGLIKDEIFSINFNLQDCEIEIESELNINSLYLELSYFEDMFPKKTKLVMIYCGKFKNKIDLNLNGSYLDLRICLINKATNKKNSLSIIKSVRIGNILDEIPIDLLKISNGLAIYEFNYEINKYFSFYGNTFIFLKLKNKKISLDNYNLEIYAKEII